MTQDALAKAADVARASIANLEKGRQKVPLDNLVRIAAVLHVDYRALLPDPLRLESRVEERVTIDSVREKAPVAAALIQRLQKESNEWGGSMRKKRMPNLGKAIQRANRLLEDQGVIEAPVDVEALAHSQGMILRFDEMEEKISGVLVKKGDRIFAAINKLHHPNRQRFTVAHELGHLLLHAKSPTVFVDDALVYFREDDSATPSDALEMEANVFAAALLMPRKLLEKDIRGRFIDAFDDSAMRALLQKYRVSQQALLIRLTRLGFLGGVPKGNQLAG
jgi:Zn-dependent peptidase ImmA (M78 family)/DNA-binding XRE family transcriptional regulator